MVIKSLLRDLVTRTDRNAAESSGEGSRKHRDEGDEARGEREWKIAALAYRRYLDENPGDFAIWVQYGHALKESGSLKDAEEAYMRALALSEGDADLMLNLGHLKKIQGDIPAAEEFYRRSFAVDQNEFAEIELSFLEGVIEAASSTQVSGWVRTSLAENKFFAEIDGRLHPVRLIFHAREDLMAEGRDGIGFTAYLPGQNPDFGLKFGYYADKEADFRVYMTFLFAKAKSVNVRDGGAGSAVLNANELRDIAAALNPDSVVYHTFVQRYAKALVQADQAFDIIFINGNPGTVSTRYRITNIAEGLQELGYSTLEARIDQTPVDVLARLDCRIAVFVRTALDQNYEYLAQSYRARGARIIYDIDDLVFDEGVIKYIDALQYLDEGQLSQYLWGVTHYRKFLLYADIVTTSTKYLADYIRDKFNLEPIVVHNTIGRQYLIHYEDALISYNRPGARFVVGYYSGTKTHQADFREAYAGIVRFMRTYPEVVLRVVGYLDLNEFPDLLPIQERIETVSFMPYYEMIEDLKECDVIIAPLEQNNPFCDAKSELKFFEAALVGRACVATPTRTYRDAAQNGKYCLLAGNATEWFDHLSTLLLSCAARVDLASNARAYVRGAYSYMAAAKIAENAYFSLPSTPSRGSLRAKVTQLRDHGNKSSFAQPNTDVDANLSIGVVICDIFEGGGGHRKIFKFCSDWAAQGQSITIYVASGDSAESLAKKVRQFYEFPCTVVNYNGILRSHDAIVCTHWSTAYSLRNFADKYRVFYFVQDFEPLFFAAGSEYAKAIGTYQYGFNVACYGAWVGAKIRSDMGVEPLVIPFTMDRSLYTDDSRVVKSVDVLFFARPSQDRRCFELGVEALRLVYKENPAIRIGLYGEDSYGDLGFRYHNFGLIRQVAKIASIYRKSKVGVCFSTTNPSLVGYEMLASGLPIVDLRVPGFEHNFGGDDFVYYASPTPESIYSAIAACLSDPNERQRRVRAGLEFASTIPDDNIIGEILGDAIKAKLRTPVGFEGTASLVAAP